MMVIVTLCEKKYYNKIMSLNRAITKIGGDSKIRDDNKVLQKEFLIFNVSSKGMF